MSATRSESAVMSLGISESVGICSMVGFSRMMRWRASTRSPRSGERMKRMASIFPALITNLSEPKISANIP